MPGGDYLEDYEQAGARYYERARELTTLEVNAAIEGALEAGATEFWWSMVMEPKLSIHNYCILKRNCWRAT